MAKKGGWKVQIKKQMAKVSKGKLACTPVPPGTTQAQFKAVIGKGKKVVARGPMLCTRVAGGAKKRSKKRK